jgi:hypothetical protein
MPGRFGLLLLPALTTVACATPPVASPATASDLAVSLRRDVSGDRPILVVTITTRSDNPVCVRAEVLQNPYSYEMSLGLRTRYRHPVGYHESGFVPPRIPGNVRLEPGATGRGEYYLDSRFRLPRTGTPFPEGMSAQAAFSYDYCDDSLSLRATSAWTELP